MGARRSQAATAPQRVARGAWLLALLVSGVAVGPQLPAPEAVPLCRPVAEVARDGDGHTAAVRCGDEDAPAPEFVRGPARLLFGLRIDPNRADESTLQSLPGIGSSRAAAIVAARQQACFEEPGDLRGVRGIGPRTLAGIEPLIEVRRPVGDCESGVACSCGGGP